MPPVLIYGAGAIGQWLGALLLSSGCPVHLHGRPRIGTAIENHGGLSLDGSEILPVSFSTSPKELRGRTFSCVILTVKTFAVKAALAELQTANPTFTDLVSFQNGWGSERFYLEAFPRHKLWTLTTTRAITVESAGVIISANKGGLAIAPWEAEGSSTPSPIELRRLPIPLIQPRSGRDQKWSKLLLNVMGNATGAITGLSPTAYARYPKLMRLELILVREAMAVGKAMGLSRIALPGFDVPLFCSLIERLPLNVMAPIVGAKMGKARGDKLPSLFQDIERPDSPTEIDDMNGAVVREGAKVSTATPYQTLLMEAFHRCRQERAFWDRLRKQPESLADLLTPQPLAARISRPHV